MSVPAIGPVGFTPFTPPTLGAGPATSAATATTGTSSAAATGAVDPAAFTADPTQSATGAQGTDFAHLLANGIERLQGLHSNADQLAVQAATGDLGSLHDYTIAATEASVATQLTTAVRNKALEAFNEIMRMPI